MSFCLNEGVWEWEWKARMVLTPCIPFPFDSDSTCEFDDDREQWDSDKSTGGNVGAGGGRAGGGGERLSLPPPNNSPSFQVMSLAVPDNLRGPVSRCHARGLKVVDGNADFRRSLVLFRFAAAVC